MYELYKIFGHFLLLVSSTYTLSKNFTFFAVLTRIVENNYLHLLHTAFIMHLLLAATTLLCNATLGTLSDSERTAYNDKLYGMLGELVMIVSFFPNDLEVASILYFSVLFAIKSVAWTFEIKAQRFCSYHMVAGGVAAALFAAVCSYACWSTLDVKFSINILFGLEYSLVALGLFKTLAVMLVDILEIEKSRSFFIFNIVIAYYAIKCIVYFVFIIDVSFSYKFPINSARSLVSTFLKLKRKVVLFRAYLQLCRDLDSIAEVEIDGNCAICTESMGVGKMLRCRHAFHAECLKMWCERETSCPICRADLAFKREESIITDNEILTGIPVDIDE